MTDYPDAENGDVYLNPFFGDLWVVEERTFVKLNEGTIINLDEPIGFIKVGHITCLKQQDSSFYTKPEPCPICKTSHITCVLDSTTHKWKIGCNTEECPCCIKHMSGSFQRREDAVYRWNHR